MDAPERFEQLIAFLGSQLPAPVEQQPGDAGAIIFTAGSPAEVVVHLTHTSVVVFEFAGVWDTAGTFMVRPRRVGLVKWRRLSETAVMNAVSSLIRIHENKDVEEKSWNQPKDKKQHLGYCDMPPLTRSNENVKTE